MTNLPLINYQLWFFSPSRSGL